MTKRLNRPAILPIGTDELLNRLTTVLGSMQQAANVRRIRRLAGIGRSILTGQSLGSLESPPRLWEGKPGPKRCSSILRAEKLLGFADQGINSASRQIQSVLNCVQNRYRVTAAAHPFDQLLSDFRNR